MGSRKGSKNISEQDRLEMCAIIAPRLKYRDSNEELRIRLEDKGYEVGDSTVKQLKRQLREGLKERFKQIGEYELAQEHTFAIEMMKDLMKTMQNSINSCENEREKVAVVSQIQSLQKDLIDYYGSTGIVENVFKYFNEDEEEKHEKEVDKVRTKVKKKTINNPKKKEIMTEF